MKMTLYDTQYLPGIGLSDHVCLGFNFKCYCQHSSVNSPRYNLYSAYFTKMRHLISNVDWNDTLKLLNLHDAWDYFLLLLIAL